jgi:hypothetical protein
MEITLQISAWQNTSNKQVLAKLGFLAESSSSIGRNQAHGPPHFVGTGPASYGPHLSEKISGKPAKTGTGSSAADKYNLSLQLLIQAVDSRSKRELQKTNQIGLQPAHTAHPASLLSLTTPASDSAVVASSRKAARLFRRRAPKRPSGASSSGATPERALPSSPGAARAPLVPAVVPLTPLQSLDRRSGSILTKCVTGVARHSRPLVTRSARHWTGGAALAMAFYSVKCVCVVVRTQEDAY